MSQKHSLAEPFHEGAAQVPISVLLTLSNGSFHTILSAHTTLFQSHVPYLQQSINP